MAATIRYACRCLRPFFNMWTHTHTQSGKGRSKRKRGLKIELPVSDWTRNAMITDWTMITRPDHHRHHQITVFMIKFYSPSGCRLDSVLEVAEYIQRDDTCKCGLPCPLRLQAVFNFDPTVSCVDWQCLPHIRRTRFFRPRSCLFVFFNLFPICCFALLFTFFALANLINICSEFLLFHFLLLCWNTQFNPQLNWFCN